MDVLNMISIISLWLSGLSALLIIMHLDKHSQPMKIMNVVWPLTAIWGGLTALSAYLSFGKSGNKPMDMKMNMGDMKDMKMDMPMPETMSMGDEKPFWQKVVLSTIHCGAGCTLADIIGEWSGPGILSLVGLHGLAWSWTYDYVLALLIGAYFQFAAIRPMLTNKPASSVFVKALKIDFLSLTAWQVGMYTLSYIILYVVLPEPLPHDTWSFWFIMQLAMCAGFLCSYPMNWFLIKRGIKPGM